MSIIAEGLITLLGELLKAYNNNKLDRDKMQAAVSAFAAILHDVGDPS